jgi:membrane-associated protein
VLALTLALSLDPKTILSDLSPYGEIGLILIIFAETGLLFGFFLPGDSLLFSAGLLAEQGKLNLAAVLIGCFAAAVIGDQVGFTIGDRAGPRLFRKPDSRLFKHEYIERTEQFFEKHGPKTIVMARFVPVVRTFAPVMAGVGNMSRRTFIAYNVAGGLASLLFSEPRQGVYSLAIAWKTGEPHAVLLINLVSSIATSALRPAGDRRGTCRPRV